jgi:hypothetical protein
MSESAELLAARKAVLIARGSLCRLKIRRDVQHLRADLAPVRLGSALVTSAPMREVALGLLIAGFGHGRIARWIRLTSRAVVLVRVAMTAYGLLKPRADAAP